MYSIHFKIPQGMKVKCRLFPARVKTDEERFNKYSYMYCLHPKKLQFLKFIYNYDTFMLTLTINLQSLIYYNNVLEN